MTKFEEFKKTFDSAISTIKSFQEDKDMKLITNWLLTTKINSYQFLTLNWKGALSTAEGVSSLLWCIHHAIVDDGDICFPVINGQPKIVFCWKGDYHLLHESICDGEDLDLNKVEFLSSLEEFINRTEQHELERMKQYEKYLEVMKEWNDMGISNK